mmetsp:Transcript_2647/g.4065  ORF Transcript_2647/g.4065 Transcript_2647/m.4065 type:complete len:85 (+) Transcript_2647:81-335(+)
MEAEDAIIDAALEALVEVAEKDGRKEGEAAEKEKEEEEEEEMEDFKLNGSQNDVHEILLNASKKLASFGLGSSLPSVLNVAKGS